VPSCCVTCSSGVLVTSGVERTNTSASRTTKPRVSVTRNRTLIAWRRDRTGLGENVDWSTIRRCGRLTLVTGIDVLPFGSRIWPPGPGGGAAAITAVVAEVAAREPATFLAVTDTRSVRPTSAIVSANVCAVAPITAAQPDPFGSQRSHWYANVNGCVPLQVPAPAISVWPSWGAPPIVGSAEFAGAVARGAMTGVDAVSDCAPAEFRACTETISRLPTSARVSAKLRPVAPPMLRQSLIRELQRIHW